MPERAAVRRRSGWRGAAWRGAALRLLGGAVALASGPVMAEPAGCVRTGASSAAVVASRPAATREDPLVVAPGTLCADLDEPRNGFRGELNFSLGAPNGNNATTAAGSRGGPDLNRFEPPARRPHQHRQRGEAEGRDRPIR